MTETASLREPPELPVRAILGDAFGALWRHRWVYLGQWVLWSVAYFLLVEIAGASLSSLAFAGFDTRAELLATAGYILMAVAFLILGSAAIFINTGRAIVLRERPTLGRGFRLGRADRPVLRAVVGYWLVAHLVPTIGAFIVHSLSVGYAAQLSLSDLVLPGYWVWVCATAPLVALAMPIALFEHHPQPLREAWRRSKGMRPRIFAITMLPILPFALMDFGLASDWPLEPSNLQSRWSMALALVLLLGWQFLHDSVPLAVITVSSAVVAAIYLRLSPRLEPIHRVFD